MYTKTKNAVMEELIVLCDGIIQAFLLLFDLDDYIQYFPPFFPTLLGDPIIGVPKLNV